LNSNYGIEFIILSIIFELTQISKGLKPIWKFELNQRKKYEKQLCTLGQIWPGPAAGRPVLGLAAHEQQSRGALAINVPWWRSGRLQPAGGDGRWGTAARARGSGEGPFRDGSEICEGSPGAVHGGAARRGEAGDGGGDRWSLVVPEGLVTGYASEQSS
jgi:hypothetical protein